jgi:acetolactate synthase-1/2/3 large subunit
MTTTVADHIAGFLRERQVELIFGLCGHTNISILAALERGGGPRFVTTRHEQVAAHAADGYARASGRPGVVLLHVGPGLTNATTGVATAALDSVPMVVIAGDVPTYYENRGPHQELNLLRDADQTSVFAPFVKRSWRLRRADQAPRVLARAWDLAQAGRPGPVLVSVPMDILDESLDQPFVPATPLQRVGMDLGLAEDIASQLERAERPLILAGGGTRKATSDLRRLAETAGLPVVHTLMGSGALPPDHEQLMGMVGFWGSPVANRLASTADLILAIGTRFPETDSSSWEPGATFAIPPTRLIHIDIDPTEPGRNYPADLAVVADAASALAAIADRARKPASSVPRFDWPALQEERRRFLDLGADNARSGSFPMKPERILADLRQAVPHAILVTDVGWNKNGIAQQYPIDAPESFLTPGGFSTMGFGPAAVLGVAAADTGRPAIALVGDGGFGAQPNVVATAVEMGIAPIWVVMNNAAFGTIAGLERKHFGTGYGCEFELAGRPYSPDYALWARACGAEGWTITGPDELLPALRRAVDAGRPVVIDVPMENTPVPTPGKWDIERIYQQNGGRVPAEV